MIEVLILAALFMIFYLIFFRSTPEKTVRTENEKDIFWWKKDNDKNTKKYRKSLSFNEWRRKRDDLRKTSNNEKLQTIFPDWVGTYKNGKADGVWKHFNEDGSLNKTRTYKNGKVLSEKKF